MNGRGTGVQVRMDPDAQRLEVLLPPATLAMSAETLLAQIKEAAAPLNVPIPLTARDLFQKLREASYGAWITLLESTPPTAPVDGRVVILQPVAPERKQAQAPYQPVSAGTMLARIEPGLPGSPGRDVLGRETPARPPRLPRLPQGEHTQVSEDGLHLLASSDGEVVLRNLLLHVIPPYRHLGDFTAGDGPLGIATGLLIQGSVGIGGRIEARGDIYIEGDIQDADVCSTRGSIFVTGSILGSTGGPSTVRAAYDLTCNRLHRADVRVGRDMRLHAEARQGSLRIGGDLYLEHPLMRSLVGVDLHIEGAVVLPALPRPEGDIAPGERQHYRAPAGWRGLIARQQEHPRVFVSCLIEDVSPGGIRCRVSSPLPAGPLAGGEIVQVKWTMPDNETIVPAICRVARVVGAQAVGLAFLQITHHDLKRLTAYCRQYPYKSVAGVPPSSAHRRTP